MNIQLIILLTKTKLFACEIDNNGKAETISIKGNTEIKCEGKESVDELITCLFDAFNIDNFAEENFDIVIIESDADKEIIKYLATRCDGASKFNIISMENILPFIATNKNMVKANEEIIVNFAGYFYKITCNENSIVKVGKARKSENAVELQDNDFACFYHFVADSVAITTSKNKLQEAKEEIDLLHRKLSSYEKELRELREVQKQFAAIKEKQKGLQGLKEDADTIYQKAEDYFDAGLYDKAFELYQKAANMGKRDAIRMVRYIGERLL